jgi:tryptophan-rich sensory protein
LDWNKVIILIVSIVACFIAGGIGSLFTFKAIPTWYPGLRKPPYTPPNWAFGPVWTTLYLLMGISVFIVWQQGLETSSTILGFVLFWIQLVINALWSLIFFGLKSKGGGVVTIVILWFLILATIITFFRVSSWSGALLVPYIVWVSIASYLNIGVWVLNKQANRINQNG